MNYPLKILHVYSELVALLQYCLPYFVRIIWSSLMSALDYIKTFIKDRNVASVAPSSPFAVRKICSYIDFPSAHTIVEYGPATGVITKELLARMRPHTRLFAIELNGDFVRILKRTVRDPRLKVFQDTVENVERLWSEQDLPSADYVISGVPLSFFDNEQRLDIIRQTRTILNPGGSFITYQVSRVECHLRDLLPKHFEIADEHTEWLNIPPLRILNSRSLE